MNNKTRKLIEMINDFYNNILDFDLTDEQKNLFETGIAMGIKFALTELIDTNIDLSVLGNGQNEDAEG
jgi:hypothetical protein